MKKNKILIIVLAIVLALLVIVAGFLFIYLQTDILKTDKQLFFKYIGETAQNFDTYDSSKLDSYFEKQQTTPYENNGKLTVVLDAPNEIKEQLNAEKVNNLSLTFSGKTDKSNNKSEEHLQLNYSDDVSFPVDLKRINDVYGIASNLVVKQYIAVDTSKLDELLTRLEVQNADAITSLFDNETPIITDEQLQAELNRYNDVILSGLKDSNFSKTEDGNPVLTLSEREAFTMLTQIVYEASVSQNLPNEVTSYMSTLLEELKEVNVNDLKSDDQFIKITANKSGLVDIKIQDLVNIQIQFTNSTITITFTDEQTTIKATVSKTEDESQVGYNIDFSMSAEDTELNIVFSANYSNIETQNAAENYILAFGVTDGNDDISYEYTLSTAKTFVNSVDIQEFKDEDTLILNNQETATINALGIALPIQIQKVNSLLLQRIGLTDEQNPLIYATPIGILSEMINTIPNLTVTDGESNDTSSDTDASHSEQAPLINDTLNEPGNVDTNNDIMIEI